MVFRSILNTPETHLPARLARRSLRRTLQSMRYGLGSLQRSPVLFANSFPKSGTHLLTQILQGFSSIGPAVDSGLPAIVSFDGKTGKARSEAAILSDLLRLLPGDIAYGHVHAYPGAIQVMQNHGFAHYFIVRDPRDVVVSHVHYITSMAERHIHHEYFNQKLSDFSSRLRASIAGVNAQDLISAGVNDISGRELPDIYSRFEPYLPWLEYPQTMLIRFEDLIHQRQDCLQTIIDHAVVHGFNLAVPNKTAINILENHINPQKSPTFRTGKTGGWKDAFSLEDKNLFKQFSEDLLQRLGYEENNDW